MTLQYYLSQRRGTMFFSINLLLNHFLILYHKLIYWQKCSFWSLLISEDHIYLQHYIREYAGKAMYLLKRYGFLNKSQIFVEAFIA